MWALQNYLSGEYSADQYIAYRCNAFAREGELIPWADMSADFQSVAGKSTPPINIKISAIIKRMGELVQNPQELTRCIEKSNPVSRLSRIVTQAYEPMKVNNLPVDVLKILFSHADRKTLDAFCATCTRFYTLKAALIASDPKKVESVVATQLRAGNYALLTSFAHSCPYTSDKVACAIPYTLGMWSESRKKALSAVADKFALLLSLKIDNVQERNDELKELLAVCPTLGEVTVRDLEQVEQATQFAKLLAPSKHIEKLKIYGCRYGAFQAFVNEMRAVPADARPALCAVDISPHWNDQETAQHWIELVFGLCALFPQIRSVSVGIGGVIQGIEIDLSTVTLPSALEALSLEEIALRSESPQQLATSCPSLQMLSIHRFASLCEHYLLTSLPQKLTSLSLGNADTPNLSKFLLGLPNLVRFSAHSLPPAVAEGALPQTLRFLSITGGQITSAGVKNILTNLPELEELILSRLTRVPGIDEAKYDGIAQNLKPLTNLRSLDLSEGSLGSASELLEHLHRLSPNLQRLELYRSKVPFSRLELPATLRELNLSEAVKNSSSADLERIFKQLPNLERVDLYGCHFRLESTSAFASISEKIESIRLMNTDFTEKDVTTIFSRCSRLKSIWLPWSISDEKVGQMKLPATLESIPNRILDEAVIRLQCPSFVPYPGT